MKAATYSRYYVPLSGITHRIAIATATTPEEAAARINRVEPHPACFSEEELVAMRPGEELLSEPQEYGQYYIRRVR